MTKKTLNLQFEKAVRLLVEYLPESSLESRKPILFHDMRVGMYLYEKEYSPSIVFAGILHDAVEWARIDQKLIRKEFGNEVLRLVLANTKNQSITDSDKKIHELIKRCAKEGEDALIVKAADILDSFKWYLSQKNEHELHYSGKNTRAIFKHKPIDFDDKIFDKLRGLIEKHQA